jgi:hypothetical protein
MRRCGHNSSCPKLPAVPLLPKVCPDVHSRVQLVTPAAMGDRLCELTLRALPYPQKQEAGETNTSFSSRLDISSYLNFNNVNVRVPSTAHRRGVLILPPGTLRNVNVMLHRWAGNEMAPVLLLPRLPEKSQPVVLPRQSAPAPSAAAPLPPVAATSGT